MTHFEANSTPTVALESMLNSSFVYLERMLVDNAAYRRAKDEDHVCADKENDVRKECEELTFSDPIVTGSAVFALKYKDGVMMCTDTLGLPLCVGLRK